MTRTDNEDAVLRSVAPQDADSILLARQRAEEEFLRTREALRESEERLKAALSAAGTGTFRWDLHTNTVHWEGNLDRLFGLETDRATQSLDAFIGAVHPDDCPAVVVGCERCAREGADFDMEFRVVWPDGSVHWIDDKARTFRDAEGNPIYVAGACADITTRKAAAEALRASEERLRAIFDQAGVEIWVADLSGRFVEMNRKFSDVLGYSADELRQITLTAITHPDDLAATETAVRQLLEGAIPAYSLEKRYVRKDQSIVWGLANVTLLRDAAGRPQQFIGVIEDITLRKRTEDALREETRILERLNETGRALASQLDLQATIQGVTDAATELSGARFGAFFYNPTEDPGDTFLLYTASGAPREAFVHFGDPSSDDLLAATFRGEGPLRFDDVLAGRRFPALGGEESGRQGGLPVRSYLSVPVRSGSGTVIGGLLVGHPDPGVFTERSERLVTGVAAQAGIAIDNARLYKAAQKAASERADLLERERAARSAAEGLSRVKDEFLATLSHELRTPLHAILGWAQILRSGNRDHADVLKGLEIIERNARAQTQLIDDMLDMSRITSGNLRLDIQPISPMSFIEAALETVQPAADAKEILIETLLDRSAGPISGDPGRLQQVAWNLLSNAIKFTPRGGQVQVLLKRRQFHVEIIVTDTGVGIRPSFIPHLFERFSQSDASTTRQYGGLGLGLSIVKNLLDLHGGTVSIESAGEGRGTTATVQLPLMVVDRPGDKAGRLHPAAPQAGPDRKIAGELAGLRIVVVDDNSDARELIKRVLEDCAAAVEAASGVSEALEMIQTHRPHVLVTDVGLRDADGFELLRRVRALGSEHGGRVPAIALTAFALSEDRTRALRAGFLVHISKPVDPSELVATVASVARRNEEDHRP